MADTYKTYFIRNLKKVIAKFGDVALLDEVAETDLAAALAAKINSKVDQTDFNTLVGSDTGKSARTIANEELAAQLIPESAKESLDTLQEIAAWIQSHPDDFTELVRKLTLGTHEVGGEQVQYDTVKDYVEAVVSSFIALTALSATTTGNGNVITAASYDNTTGVTTFTKGVTAITESDLVDLTDAEVDALFA